MNIAAFEYPYMLLFGLSDMKDLKKFCLQITSCYRFKGHNQISLFMHFGIFTAAQVYVMHIKDTQASGEKTSF